MDDDSALRRIENAARRLTFMVMWPNDNIGQARALSSRITAALAALELGQPERVETVLDEITEKIT